MDINALVHVWIYFKGETRTSAEFYLDEMEVKALIDQYCMQEDKDTIFMGCNYTSDGVYIGTVCLDLTEVFMIQEKHMGK